MQHDSRKTVVRSHAPPSSRLFSGCRRWLQQETVGWEGKTVTKTGVRTLRRVYCALGTRDHIRRPLRQSVRTSRQTGLSTGAQSCWSEESDACTGIYKQKTSGACPYRLEFRVTSDVGCLSPLRNCNFDACPGIYKQKTSGACPQDLGLTTRQLISQVAV